MTFKYLGEAPSPSGYGMTLWLEFGREGIELTGNLRKAEVGVEPNWIRLPQEIGGMVVRVTGKTHRMCPIQACEETCPTYSLDSPRHRDLQVSICSNHVNPYMFFVPKPADKESSNS